MEVRDACTSVKSEVLRMLVCLVSDSRRGQLERRDSSTDEVANMAEVPSLWPQCVARRLLHR